MRYGHHRPRYRLPDAQPAGSAKTTVCPVAGRRPGCWSPQLVRRRRGRSGSRVRSCVSILFDALWECKGKAGIRRTRSAGAAGSVPDRSSRAATAGDPGEQRGRALPETGRRRIIPAHTDVLAFRRSDVSVRPCVPPRLRASVPSLSAFGFPHFGVSVFGVFAFTAGILPTRRAARADRRCRQCHRHRHPPSRRRCPMRRGGEGGRSC